MVARTEAAWQPTPLQELLLRAAWEEGEVARAAWSQWIASVDLDALDAGSQRVLPLLYRNLLTLGIDHPQVARLGRVYRYTWVNINLAVRQMEEILAELEKRGISTLVLKGAATALRYYGDLGTRPMADFDILVPTEQTDAAMVILTEMGWNPIRPLQFLTEPYRVPIHGVEFEHPEKQTGFDLHWHVTHLHLAPIYDVPFWEAAVPLQVGTVQTRMLCPADQLLHMCFNGYINEEGNNIRWLPDALMLLAKEPNVEWARVVEQSERLELTLPVGTMLNYLRTVWNMPIPSETINALTEARVSYRMHRVYECLATFKPKRSWSQALWLLYSQYVWSQSHTVQGFHPVGFVQYLRHRWTLGGTRSTFRYAILRAMGVDAEKALDRVQ